MSLLLGDFGVDNFHGSCMYRFFPCERILVATTSDIHGYLVHCKLAEF